MKLPIPKEFNRFRVGAAHVVTHQSCEAWARDVLVHQTLYAWAAASPDHVVRRGRLPAYSVPLPDGTRRVVVRHSHHGGLLGPLRGDRFFPPTRAPYELLVSHVLAATGVRTPPVVAIAVYPAGWVFRRSDVVTLELPGRDLGAAFQEERETPARDLWLASVAELVRALTRAGAWHPDLHVGNILLVRDAGGDEQAFVLDVDRIRFATPGDPNVLGANLDRFERSVRKWRNRHGSGFDDQELRRLRAIAAAPAAT